MSVSTVSLVLSGRAGQSSVRISDRTVKRVRGLALELGYQSKGIVGLVVPQTDTYFASIISSARVTFRDAGFSMAIGPTSWNKSEEVEEISLMEEKGFDGIIAAVSPEVGKGIHELLHFFLDRRRAVALNWKFEGVPGATVDHEKCGYLAGQHLVKMGHKSIWFVGASYPTADTVTGASIVDARYQGFRKAVEAAGLQPHSEESVVAFANLCDSPKGAYCGRAIVALDLLSACVDAGVRVPDDISIVGQDNDREKSAVRPRTSTIDVRSDKVGAEAARMLIGMINGESPEDVVVEPELIVRDSTQAL